MALHKAIAYGQSRNIIESEVGLVVKTRTGTQTMATTVDGRKVIREGDLFTSGTEYGVVLGDYDMTDDTARPIAVVVEGRLVKANCSTAAQGKATELAAAGIKLI